MNALKVLIAVDDSTESREAVTAAYRFFGPQADYSVLSVGDRAPIFVGGYGAGGMSSSVDIQQQLDIAHDVAERASEEAAKHLPPGVEAEVVDVGDPGSVICSHAADHASDVIVIGSHDRNFWDRLFDPSVGRYVIEHAPCPVLVVR